MSEQNHLTNAILECERIVFVCSGNIIRSAFADVYSHHRGIPDKSKIKNPKKISSLGTTYFNSSIHENTETALKDQGIPETDIRNFIPTHISRGTELKDGKTVFFGMKYGHLEDLEKMVGNVRGRAFLLTELIPDEFKKCPEIRDPYFEGGWEETYELIKRCVDQLVLILNQ